MAGGTRGQSFQLYLYRRRLGERRLRYKYNWKDRSEEHTSELQSRFDLVCRLLLEKKKKNNTKKELFTQNSAASSWLRSYTHNTTGYLYHDVHAQSSCTPLCLTVAATCVLVAY